MNPAIIIRRLRKSAKLSAAKLAAAVGVSRQAIHDYESGRFEPSFKNVRAIVKACKASLAAFD